VSATVPVLTVPLEYLTLTTSVLAVWSR
jgi:hypothetical protein